MNVQIELESSFVRLSGSPLELDTIEDMLFCWSGQFSPDGTGRCRVTERRDPGSLWVLTGAWLGFCEEWGESPLGDLTLGVPAVPDLSVWSGALRSYQLDAVRAVLSAPLWRSIVKAPPGAGKTHMAAGIMAGGAALGLAHWVYLVQNRELAAQAERTLREVAPRLLGLLGGDELSVTCGSYGTVDTRALEGAQGLIVDEVHGAAAPTRAAVLGRSRAVLRCGLSATPLLRQDARNALVLGLLGPVRYEVRPEDLIAQGHLARGRYHLICL